MRQTAWLNTPPKDKKGKYQKTRLERLKKDGKTPSLPATPKCHYLLDYLLDAGTFLSTGMGRAPLPHSEIAAWQSNTGIELTAWEASTLRILSATYVAAAADAEEPDCKPPYVDSATNAKVLHLEMVNDKLDRFLD